MKDARRFVVATLLWTSGLFISIYVGSYLALVVPEGRSYLDHVGDIGNRPFTVHAVSNYRAGGAWAEQIYLPLETIDRQLRPQAWRFRLNLGSPYKWSPAPPPP